MLRLGLERRRHTGEDGGGGPERNEPSGGGGGAGREREEQHMQIGAQSGKDGVQKAVSQGQPPSASTPIITVM